MTKFDRRYIVVSGALGFLLGAGAMVLLLQLLWNEAATASTREQTSRPEVTVTVPTNPRTEGKIGNLESVDEARLNGAASSAKSIQDRKAELAHRKAARIERSLNAIMNHCDEDYTVLFSSLGLDESLSAALKQDIGIVVRSKIEAVEALAEFNSARSEYDRKVKALLGEKYPEYLEFENGTFARRQTELIESFASTNRVGSLGSDESMRVTELIRQFEAYTPQTADEYWGPYADPATLIGGPNAASRFEQRYNTLVQRSDQLLAAARESGISPVAASLLAQYYDAEVQKALDTVVMARNPDAFFLARMELRLRDMRDNPAANPARVRQMESVVEALRRRVEHP